MGAGADPGIFVVAPVDEVVTALRAGASVVGDFIGRQAGGGAGLAGEVVERARVVGVGHHQLAGSMEAPERRLGLDGQLLRLWSALEHGDIDVAWRQLDLCRRLAGPLRLPHYDWVTAVVESGLHIAMGSLDEAERLTLYARDAQERTDDATIVLFTEAQRVYVRFIRGHLDAIDELRQIAVKCSLVSGVLECSLILSYARAGQRERARTELAALAADDFARVPRTSG